MNIGEIIKDSFVFPSKNIKILLIYIVLSIAASLLSIGGVIFYLIGFISPEFLMWGGMACVISMLIGWLLSGYLISVVKSGIDLDDNVPEFTFWKNFNTGFDNFIVSVVYGVIPTIITIIAGYLTNIYGNFIVVAQEIFSQIFSIAIGTSTNFALDTITQAITNLAFSIATTVTIAVIVFLIFAFLQTMGEARLANTGSICEAINIFEAAKDIKRIGIAKVIVVILVICIIIGIIEMILSYVPILAIISIIIVPYLTFFAQRAIGLLYSDIA